MGQRKTKLLQRDQYSLWRAIEAITELIRDACRGTAGPSKVIVEAVGSDDWDDVEVHHHGDPIAIDHWQVKRQTSNLSHTIFKAAIKRVPSLQGGAGTARRRFYFGFLNLTAVKVGKVAHELRILQDLCAESRMEGLDVDAFVASLATAKKAWWQFLAKTLGDSDSRSLIDVVRTLHVVQLNSEADVKTRCIDNLKQIYENPDLVLNSLVALVNEQPDGRVIFDYALLRAKLLNCGTRRAGVPDWCTMARSYDWSNWEYSGTLSRDRLVEVCWSDGSPTVVGVQGPPSPGDQVSPALLRLAAHRKQPARIGFDPQPKWDEQLVRACGGTLGLGMASVLPTLEAHSGADAIVDPISEHPDQLAGGLADSMDHAIWAALVDRVGYWISAKQGPWGASLETALCSAMNTKWNQWRSALDADMPTQAHFLRSLLCTASEHQRSTFSADVRLGPVTVEILSQAILLALAIAVALDDGRVDVAPCRGPDAENLTVGESTAHLISLRSASGSDGQPADIDVLAATLLPAERGIAILSGTSMAALDLMKYVRGAAGAYHLDDTERSGFEHDATVAPVITFERKLSQAIEQGSNAVGSVINDIVNEVRSDKWQYLTRAVDAAIRGSGS